jgi:hypothetical protein
LSGLIVISPVVTLLCTGIASPHLTRSSWRGSSCESATTFARSEPAAWMPWTTSGDSGTCTFTVCELSTLKSALPSSTSWPPMSATSFMVPMHEP